MPHMQQVIEWGEWVECDGTNGVEVFPADLIDVAKLRRWLDSESPWAMDKVNKIVRDYVGGTILSAQITSGYGARLSAPGYMDCTEWTVFGTEEAAQEYLNETYPYDEEGNDDENA